MKNIISFLFSKIGIVFVSLVIVCVSILFHKGGLDDRWWLTVLITIVMSLAANFYLEWGTDWGSFVKIIGVTIVAALTLSSIILLISLKLGEHTLEPTDFTLISVTVESLSGTLLFIWFSFFRTIWVMGKNAEAGD